jgi:hypothetical protein
VNYIEVELTPSEIQTGASIGIRRHCQNIYHKRRPSWGVGTDNNWQLHVEGALGECVIARHLNIYWNGNLGEFHMPDVAQGKVEVRATASHNNRLILHPTDKDDHAYWLVTGANGTYRIQGYIMGRDGKQQKWWEDPQGNRPAFFVPQAALIRPWLPGQLAA